MPNWMNWEDKGRRVRMEMRLTITHTGLETDRRCEIIHADKGKLLQMARYVALLC